MKKIIVIVGTRPEVIKLAPLYLELKKSKKLKPILVNTGQHKEMTKQMLNWFSIKEDFNLQLMEKNQDLQNLTARVVEASHKLFKKIKPHLVVVEGDTITVMAASIAAFYLRIPIAHVEAGLRTNDIYNPFPEEIARRLVSHIATFHFAPTVRAVTNLKKENIKNNVFLTGNTVIDSLLFTEKRISKLKNIFKNKKVVLVTLHRRENFGKVHRQIAQTLVKISKIFPDTLIFLPIHKNPNVRKVLLPVLRKRKNIFISESLDYASFMYVMKNCYLILTDSGGIQEEAPSLRKPVLVLRTKTERPEGIKAGCAMLVGTNPTDIFKWTSKLLLDKKLYKKMSTAKNPYGDGKASKRIVKILSNIF